MAIWSWPEQQNAILNSNDFIGFTPVNMTIPSNYMPLRIASQDVYSKKKSAGEVPRNLLHRGWKRSIIPTGRILKFIRGPLYVSRRGAKENADIIEHNNRQGERSVIVLFTGTRGEVFSKAFVQEIISRNIDLSLTKFFLFG